MRITKHGTLALLIALTGLVSSGHAASLKSAQRIDRYVVDQMREQHIPGLEVGIYRRGDIVLAKGYGLANVELNVPVRPEMMFQSGSTGKQFTATAVMMLVEAGKVSLDDSIVKYFDGAPETWKPIKVKNLLSHTSGLGEYINAERTQPFGPFYLRQDLTEDELLRRIEAMQIDFPVGEKWRYTNTNYALLGILIHKVTGQFYGDFLAARIFRPLGMASTRIVSDIEIVPNRAAGYELEGGVLKNQAWVSPTFNSTADGMMYYNVLDLAKWDGALYTEKLLRKSSLDQMWTVFALNDGKPNERNYGFAWEIQTINNHRVIQHGGSWQGFRSYIARYVDDGITVVVLSNVGPSHAGTLVHVIAGLYDPALAPEPETK